jgi:two-component system OmpR family response regulator
MSAEPLVLAVDDEAGILRLIKLELSTQGFRVVTAENGETALRMAEEHRPDIVLLDIVMPDITGLEVMRKLRERTNIPVILLTAKGSDADKVRGLEMGADDYLAKPVNSRELLARMRNILRRVHGAGTPATNARARLFRFGGWQLDSVARELSDPHGQRAALRNSEYRVLSSLLAHGNRVVSRGKLFELARGRDAGPFDRSIDVRISRLRQVLGDDARGPRIIKTVHGEGYVIGVPVERA